MSIMLNPDLKRRIIELSYKNKLSHLGSCLTAVDIIDNIFLYKYKDEPFILSSGHAGIALYVVLEKYFKLDAQKIYEHHGIHPDRCYECRIDCSTGSLGHGVGIAVGMAIANKLKNIYCLASDGELAEGSIYEALNIAKQLELRNFQLHINCNGYSAYRRVYDYQIAEFTSLYRYLNVTLHRTKVEWPLLQGMKGHYHILSTEEYSQGKKFYTEKEL